MNYLKIGNHELPINFGQNALRVFTVKYGLKMSDLEKLGEILDYDKSLQLILFGLKDGHRLAIKNGEIEAGQKFELTIEDFCDLLDEDLEALGRAMEMFADSLPGNNTKKNGQAAKQKSKPQTK